MVVIDKEYSNIASENIVAKDIEELDLKVEQNEEAAEVQDEPYSDSDEVKDESSDNEEVEGWADAMHRVLAKTGPKNAKTMVLAKESLPEEDPEQKKQKTEKKKRLKRKRAWEDINYKKPDALKKNFERDLKKTATRGVVQLFNAVRKYQTDMEDKLEDAKTETKKERLYKNINKGKFMELINRDDKSGQMHDVKDTVPGSPAEEDEDQPAWKVLRDDYMVGNDMANWDKRDGEDENDKKNKNLKEKVQTKKKQRNS